MQLMYANDNDHADVPEDVKAVAALLRSVCEHEEGRRVVRKALARPLLSGALHSCEDDPDDGAASEGLVGHP